MRNKSSKFKTLGGILMIICGILFGLYVGVWLCFIGGIVGIIETIRAPELSAMVVAINIVKILGAGVAGFISGVVLVIPGWLMIWK